MVVYLKAIGALDSGDLILPSSSHAATSRQQASKQTYLSEQAHCSSKTQRIFVPPMPCVTDILYRDQPQYTDTRVSR